ncbi:chorismate mutase [Pontibacter sp. BAB1700]|nr:chorismate mutase [Pontibacter sp. BAB1700]
MNPDLALWIGAIERIYQSGITDLAAIHRGFSSYQPLSTATCRYGRSPSS